MHRRMGSHDRLRVEASASVTKHDVGRSHFLQHAGRQTGLLIASVLAGIAVGVVYRLLFDPPTERDVANFLRSGLQGAGIALAVFAVQVGFASGARSRLGSALRRLPVAGEVLLRAVVMAAVVIVVSLALQFLLYWQPLHLRWLTPLWLTVTLPRVVLIGFGFSLVVSVVTETRRLIGGALLTSVLLGTYHRPVRQQLIVMFLDIAHSTGLAESMGELRVHDLITRFFFDIDEPIRDNGGTVHAYVGDEIIVSWPVTADLVRNARCVLCFFAIERKMARLAEDYHREFEVAPAFRAGMHAGSVIVSECGDAKRQLALFGDTMNVAARLCEYCKAVDRQLVVSGDLLGVMAIPADLTIDGGKSISVRGRREQVTVHVIEPERTCPLSTRRTPSPQS
jgi:class 3 adenylate cyclase